MARRKLMEREEMLIGQGQQMEHENTERERKRVDKNAQELLEAQKRIRQLKMLVAGI